MSAVGKSGSAADIAEMAKMTHSGPRCFGLVFWEPAACLSRFPDLSAHDNLP
jgi:hypothetical protein